MTYRELVLHVVEEFARHAGHADIIREQVAGAQAGQLTMAGGHRGQRLHPAWRRESADA